MTKNRQTMREMSHTNPQTNDATTGYFARGPRLMTDGSGEKQTMADVDHTPPHQAPGANRVFERGNEGRR
ncbi:hypothetical protein [Haladaptatus sp. DFWS20]|uniref:hypothetical protein n=1 Tax=Haladaptatus sp. DFWS20 TaxID=3403467 RepID=UPI003EBC73A6